MHPQDSCVHRDIFSVGGEITEDHKVGIHFLSHAQHGGTAEGRQTWHTVEIHFTQTPGVRVDLLSRRGKPLDGEFFHAFANPFQAWSSVDPFKRENEIDAFGGKRRARGSRLRRGALSGDCSGYEQKQNSSESPKRCAQPWVPLFHLPRILTDRVNGKRNGRRFAFKKDQKRREEENDSWSRIVGADPLQIAQRVGHPQVDEHPQALWDYCERWIVRCSLSKDSERKPRARTPSSPSKSEASLPGTQYAFARENFLPASTISAAGSSRTHNLSVTLAAAAVPVDRGGCLPRRTSCSEPVSTIIRRGIPPQVTCATAMPEPTGR